MRESALTSHALGARSQGFRPGSHAFSSPQVCASMRLRCTEGRPQRGADHSHTQPERYPQQAANLRKARAMATRCFSPPLSFSPRSPTVVAQPAKEKGSKVGGGAAFPVVTASTACFGRGAAVAHIEI